MVLRVCAAISGAAILFVYSSSAMAKLGIVVKSTAASRHDACAMASPSLARRRCMILFNPDTMKAAYKRHPGRYTIPSRGLPRSRRILRETFGGVRHGKEYRPVYALVEVANKRAIVKTNDVGPLKPGPVIDFNKQTMRYFDPTLERRLVHSVKITPLPGRLGNRPN